MFVWPLFADVALCCTSDSGGGGYQGGGGYGGGGYGGSGGGGYGGGA